MIGSPSRSKSKASCQWMKMLSIQKQASPIRLLDAWIYAVGSIADATLVDATSLWIYLHLHSLGFLYYLHSTPSSEEPVMFRSDRVWTKKARPTTRISYLVVFFNATSSQIQNAR